MDPHIKLLVGSFTQKQRRENDPLSSAEERNTQRSERFLSPVSFRLITVNHTFLQTAFHFSPHIKYTQENEQLFLSFNRNQEDFEDTK